MILYASNVHTGGGFVLLRSLLASRPAGQPLIAFLDARAQAELFLPSDVTVHWVQPSVLARMRAQLTLRRLGREGETLLCFHGLPPVFRNRARTVVFLQNRLYISGSLQHKASPVYRLRLGLERTIGRLFRRHVAEYIVQTPSMARTLRAWLGGASVSAVRILPFLDLPELQPRAAGDPADWDFVYVADGVAHKNHATLFEAWRLLAEAGIRPSLALTLTSRDGHLLDLMEQYRRDFGLQIHNLGSMPHEEVLHLYRRSRAVIFPSTTESFGIPLIEASRLGLPLLASELDYVRDVCEPVQTFDPASAHSIACAVRRFLGVEQPPVEPASTQDFWSVLDAEGRS